MPATEHHSIIIIGAGLSGLFTAWKLQQNKYDAIVLEARDRTGGRILSPQINGNKDGCIDMGPAWVWPEFQPRLQRLLSDIHIELFKQNTNGDMLYEMDANTVERYSDQSSHEMSYRIAGGANKVIKTLQSELPHNSVHLNTRVSSIEKTEPAASAQLQVHAVKDEESIIYSADKIVLALPPRLTKSSISFHPTLPADVLQAWENTPTWMAGHCKIVFIYDKPFWRENNLSGEVFSRQGPLTEIYDGSPADESSYALTSFVGLNAQQRKQMNTEQLLEMCLAQLYRLFGEESKIVKDIQIKDWSLEQYTTTETDLSTTPQHPQYPADMSRTLWNNQIILAGTEVAREHGGYIEGALESAEEALTLLNP
ncbi:MAG: amine oxidase [Thiotrichaceae bacterium]|nr:MAG: amine oxidase [Thiotrichaceae bacterium]